MLAEAPWKRCSGCMGKRWVCEGIAKVALDVDSEFVGVGAAGGAAGREGACVRGRLRGGDGGSSSGSAH